MFIRLKDRESNSDLKLLMLLNKLAFYFESNEGSTNENEYALKFLSVYDKNYETPLHALNYAKSKLGGVGVTELVLRIFCALVWHTSSVTWENLRGEDGELTRNETVAHAYKAAESTRMFIIEQQQMFKLKRFKDEDAGSSVLKPSLVDILNEKVI